MEYTQEYPDYPLTSTRTIAWDSPSVWSDTLSDDQHTTSSSNTSTTIATFQPLTAGNLSVYAKSHVSSKQDTLARYYTSIRNNSTDALRLLPKQTDTNNRRSSINYDNGSHSTKNVAIDAHPLPFPYHNDCIFLPTVETGRTRFDSESTQSLYDSQPSSPTLSAFSSNKRHVYTSSRHHHNRRSPSLAPSRGHVSYHRRESNASRYSSVTSATKKQQHRTSFQATKNQFSSLLQKSRLNGSGTHRRLSMFLTKKQISLKISPSRSANQETKSMNRPAQTSPCDHNNLSGSCTPTCRSSSALSAIREYYQTSPPSSPSSSISSPSYNAHSPVSMSSKSVSTPPHSPVTTCTYTTDNDMTVISSSTFPHDFNFRRHRRSSVYMPSPSQGYKQHKENHAPPLPCKHRQHDTHDNFFSRFARKLWPFKHA